MRPLNEAEHAVYLRAGRRVEYASIVWTSVESVAGILLAYVLHLKDREKAEEIAASMPVVTNVLEHKYWVDEIYQAAIVEPLRKLGQMFFWFDRFIVDGVVWLFSFVPQLSGFSLKLSTQRGYLQGYAATMLLGVGVILLLLFL